MYRHDPKHNRDVTLKAFTDPEHHAHCPIKLILALSLRFGNVVGSSVEAVISEAFRRRDKTVGWIEPDMPVMPAIHNAGHRLVLGKPLTVDGIRSNVTRAGKLAGIVGHLATHDVRRGSARDMASAEQPITGIATAGVARALGHTTKSLNAGLTDAYVGSSFQDHWTRRIEEGTSNPQPTFGLEIAPAGYVEPRLRPGKVTALCNEAGVDPSNRKARNVVAARHHRESFQDWIKAGTGVDPDGETHTASMPGKRNSPPSTSPSPCIAR